MFRSPAAEFIYVRTYSRWLEEELRRENWPDTVDRYINFIKESHGSKIPPKVLRKIREYLITFGVMPSMRFLWAAGAPARADNTTIYNCSFAAIDHPDVFAEALYILMCGTGFGFSVEKKYVSQLPVVPHDIFPTGQVYEVEDSKDGWADSVKFLVNSLYSGQDPTISYNKIRPAGARLKTMGGRSSGPGPLAQLHYFIKAAFHEARGRKLTTVECLDIMCEEGSIVVVGGVRRSSEISISDLDDVAIRDAKSGIFPVRRYMSNNSATYYIKPDIVTFMGEWTSLIASRSGERGIFNLEAARKMAPKRRIADLIAGTNPCVTGDTKILTDSGYKRIDSLLDQKVIVWNGHEWSEVEPKVTGRDQPMVTVTFSDGRALTCTEYHTFHIAKEYTGDSHEVKAKDLRTGMKLIKHDFPIIEHGVELSDMYLQGFHSAEGMDGYGFIWVYLPKENCLKRLQAESGGRVTPDLNYGRYKYFHDKDLKGKSYVPFDGNIKSKLDWLSGLFDRDATELKEGGLQLWSVSRSFVSDLQELLSTLGVQSKILLANKEGIRSLPDGHGGKKDFYCQESWRICVGAVQMQALKKIGLSCERMKFEKTPQRDASQFVTIVDIKEANVEDKVYCFNEPKRHLGIFNGVITGQCAEIQLRSHEFCNLSEVVAREEDDIGTMLDKVETATWMGIIQACYTYFPYLSDRWKNNCEEERLLGVSITGQFDAPHLFTEEAIRAYKSKAIKVAKKASEIMGIPMPAAITCVKPSGTVSQLVDSASGLHPRFAKFYIRRYRIASVDPLLKMIRDQGVPLSPDNAQRKQDYAKAWKAYESAINGGESATEAMKKAKSICSIFDNQGWTADKVNTWVVSFPVASPNNAITVEDVTALEQLEWYKKIQKNWCEHNASITVYVRSDEWLSVGDWVYKNWDIVNGVSFLPVEDNLYEQAPYEKISKEEYEKMSKNFPKIDYSQLSKYEQEDNTEGAKSLACSSGNCDIT